MSVVIRGTVIKGRQVGRKLGFPTINIAVPRSIKKSQYGVYFSLVSVGDKNYPGVTHLGPPSTFGLRKATCETHILTWKRDYQHQAVTKRLVLKLRDIEKYDSVKALKKQIIQDVYLARKFFGL